MSTRKKILFLTDAPSPYKVNFLEKLSLSYEAKIIFLKNKLEDRDDRWFASTMDLNCEYLNDLSFFQTLMKVLTIDLSQYDAYINMIYTSIFSIILALRFRLGRKPVIMHADGGIYIDRGPIMNFCIGRVMKLNNYFLSTGKLNTDYYLKYGINSNQSFTYRYSSTWKNEVATEYRNKVKETVEILSVGQMIDRKGFDVLLKAVNELVRDGFHCHLTMVGGDLNENCRNVISKNKNLSTVTTVIPFVQKDDLKKIYQKADMFILMTREDIWGLVISEAMCNGLPVISTENCGCAVEVLSKFKAGIVVPVDNVEACVDAVYKICKDDETYSYYSNQALCAARSYSMDNMISDYESILNRIIH